MSIKSALNSLPSKPGLIIALMLVPVVLSFYYLNQYRLCRNMATLRTGFYKSVAQNKNKVLYLADIIPFKWQRVKIMLDFQNKGKLPNCPFNSDWTQKHRKQLMEKRRLNVMVFAGKNAKTVIDVDAKLVNFDLTDTVFTDSAKFRIDKLGSDKAQYLLSQIK